jgi:hypothetical protein
MRDTILLFVCACKRDGSKAEGRCCIVRTALVKVPALKLLRYDAMVKAIECAASLDEVKEIRAKAVALEAYARQAIDEENERKCRKIGIRAERRAGELLREAAGKVPPVTVGKTRHTIALPSSAPPAGGHQTGMSCSAVAGG